MDVNNRELGQLTSHTYLVIRCNLRRRNVDGSFDLQQSAHQGARFSRENALKRGEGDNRGEPMGTLTTQLAFCVRQRFYYPKEQRSDVLNPTDGNTGVPTS